MEFVEEGPFSIVCSLSFFVSRCRPLCRSSNGIVNNLMEKYGGNIGDCPDGYCSSVFVSWEFEKEKCWAWRLQLGTLPRLHETANDCYSLKRIQISWKTEDGGRTRSQLAGRSA